ncbi:MAG: M81 family metallopeptidase, partial [Phycisphaerales bacterium]|nr:M81 family metallopeptidase [Phycisphaerales bacterium]
MRIATLGIHHETNTYSPVAADHAQCLADGIERGDEIIETYQNAQSTLTGFIDDASKTYGFELVPLIFAHTGPIGTITKDAFDRIAGEMIALLEANGPWDGVLLANHGAAVSEEYPDVDGEIARRVRVLVGQKVPTGKALDLHGNLSPAMVDHTDAIVFYRTNPHLDARPLALECAEIIVRTIKGEVKPIQTLEMPSLVINIIKQ